LIRRKDISAGPEIQQNYSNNLSDHKIITCIKNDILLISFNVEHFLQINIRLLNEDRIPVHTDKYKYMNETMRRAEGMIVPEYFQKIIDTKNTYICDEIQKIINSTNETITKVILNIQEGYPSIYKKLVNTLRFRGRNGKPTKLICQNLYEGWINVPISDYQNDPDIIHNRAKELEPDYGKHTRGWHNPCFFSIVFDISLDVLYPIRYLSEEPSITYDDNKKFPYEDALSKHILRNQSITHNDHLFIQAQPVLLYFDIYKNRNHGINKGCSILSCRGINFSIYGYNFINIHISYNGDIYDISRINPVIDKFIYNTLGIIQLREINTFSNNPAIADYSDVVIDHYDNLHQILKSIYETPRLLVLDSILLGDFNILPAIGGDGLNIQVYDNIRLKFTEMLPYYQGFDHFISIELK
jgi:hypothetical protein